MPLDASLPPTLSAMILFGRSRWRHAIAASRAARLVHDRASAVRALNDAAFYRGWLQYSLGAARRSS